MNSENYGHSYTEAGEYTEPESNINEFLKTKKKIYIAGPITGMEEKAKVKFNEAETLLRAKGYEVINPMKLPHFHDKEWKSYMKECLQALFDCDEIFMLTGWRKSKGAVLEHKVALGLDLEIHYKGS